MDCGGAERRRRPLRHEAIDLAIAHAEVRHSNFPDRRVAVTQPLPLCVIGDSLEVYSNGVSGSRTHARRLSTRANAFLVRPADGFADLLTPRAAPPDMAENNGLLLNHGG